MQPLLVPLDRYLRCSLTTLLELVIAHGEPVLLNQPKMSIKKARQRRSASRRNDLYKEKKTVVHVHNRLEMSDYPPHTMSSWGLVVAI